VSQRRRETVINCHRPLYALYADRSILANIDVAAIRERLQVGYVLEGSVRRSGDLVRITAQFIDTSNGYHLWSDTFDRDLEDIFEVQDEVARKITDALQIILSDRSQAYLKQSPLANVEAYDAYLHGLAALRKPLEGNVLDEAEGWFEQANSLKPGFAGAWAGLGKTLARLGQAEEAEAYLQQAVTRDPGYWSAQNALGSFYFNQGQAEKSVAPYRRVTLLAPDYVIGHNNLGAAHMRTGSFDQAVAAFADALALGPDRNAYSNAGSAQYFLRQFDAAAEMYRNAISLSPENYQLWGHLGDALLAAGSSALALEAYQRAAELTEGVRAIDASDPTLQVSLARYYGNFEREAEARALLDDTDLPAADMYVYYAMSLALIAVGDLSNAIQALRQSLAAGYQASLIDQDPGFDALRQRPKFDTLLQSVR
jgi:tetratricopeptide (TPR) repeat protein